MNFRLLPPLIAVLILHIVSYASTDDKSDAESEAARTRNTVSNRIPPRVDFQEECRAVDEQLVIDPLKNPESNLTVLFAAYSSLTVPRAPSYTELPIESAGQTNGQTSRANGDPTRFQWRSAALQSLAFLGFQHGSRLLQAKTRRELKGPFFRDYLRSIRGLRQWDDGDSFLTNYIGHPAMGAVSGYIQIHNDPSAKRLEIGLASKYWKSRFKAFAWSAAYSTQFELGPISEATIGSVGKKRGTAGYVDLVVTPTLGTGLIVLEDALDALIIKRLEVRNGNPHFRRTARMILNPIRSFANLLRLKTPWHRDRL